MHTLIIIYGLVETYVMPLFVFWIPFIRFGVKLYRQTAGIPMGTNCSTVVAVSFLFCYERDFLKSIFTGKADIRKAFNSSLRYLDNL